MSFLVDIVEIRNIGNSIVQIGVAEADITDYVPVGTDLTDVTSGPDITGSSVLFDGSGTVRILPGKVFTIEQNRINLGQLQNYIDRRQVQALFMTRDLSNLTDRS